MNLKTARIVTAVLLVAVIAVLGIGYFAPSLLGDALFPLMIVLLIAMSAVVITKMKCPKCGKAIRPFGQKYCAYCGKEIDWEA